jgi:hypothetical protein
MKEDADVAVNLISVLFSIKLLAFELEGPGLALACGRSTPSYGATVKMLSC